jgi:hypothetical protein
MTTGRNTTRDYILALLALAVLAIVVAISSVSLTRSFCDVHPEYCGRCPIPGTCGEPDIWVCCIDGGGCVAVLKAAECEGDIYSCDWGESTVGADGKPAVICYE